jgi:hypothetical protein
MMEMKMRTAIMAILIAFGIGLIGTPGASAGASNGAVIGEAARASFPVLQVPCRMRRVCNRYGCRSVRRCW